jgi:hypothetical protein
MMIRLSMIYRASLPPYIQGGPKATLSKKIKYLCYGSSKQAHFFTSNKGMFTLRIHKDKARENLS